VIAGLNTSRCIRICVGGGAQLWHCGVQLLRLGRERAFRADPRCGGRITRLCLGVHRHNGRVENNGRLCEQLCALRLLSVAIREQSEHGDANDGDGNHTPRQLPSVFLEKFPRGGHQLGDVVLFELSAMLGLHITRSGWWLVG
jgi:hypothetical protein